MQRNVTQVLPAQDLIDDGDMHLRRALPQVERTSLGPFVFIDHYRHRSRCGIGDRPHPHAGIEVVSYLLEGGVEHRDSMGFRDRLGPGDAQFIRTGRGMLHAEQPSGGRHGVQLWISLPPELKHVEPSYSSLRAAEIPNLLSAGSRLYVVAGRVNGVQGPMALSGGAVFARLQLDSHVGATLEVEPTAELGIYILQGRVKVGDTALAASRCGARCFSGPFVMDTPERLKQAQRDFATGRMGRLEGIPF